MKHSQTDSTTSARVNKHIRWSKQYVVHNEDYMQAETTDDEQSSRTNDDDCVKLVVRVIKLRWS